MKALQLGHILVLKGVQFLAKGLFVCWRKIISGPGVLLGMNMKSPLRKVLGGVDCGSFARGSYCHQRVESVTA